MFIINIIFVGNFYNYKIMFFYKIDKNTEKGILLKKLMDEISLCHSESEKFAKEIKAIAYIPDSENDFGGISAVEFTETPNNKIWEKLPNTEEIKGDFYVPKVEIRKFFLKEKDESKYKSKNSYIISQKSFLKQISDT